MLFRVSNVVIVLAYLEKGLCMTAAPTELEQPFQLITSWEEYHAVLSIKCRRCTSLP
jgi:hypothetical protein